MSNDGVNFIGKLFNESISDVAYLIFLLISIFCWYRAWGVISALEIELKKAYINILDTYNPLGKEIVNSNPQIIILRLIPILLGLYTSFFVSVKFYEGFIIIICLWCISYFLNIIILFIVGIFFGNKVIIVTAMLSGKFIIILSLFQIIFLIVR